MTDNDDRDATRAQPQWGPGQQPQYEQPQYEQPQYGQPQYGQYDQQPQYGQPQYGQYGQQEPWQQQGYAPLQPPPAQKSKRGRAIGGAVAAVVLIGGGIGTYVAVSSGSDSGSSSPRAAVQKLVADLDKSDLIGVLNDLPPGERAAIVDPFNQQIDQLKKNDVVASNADTSDVSGIDVQASKVTYDDQTVTINDHVQVVQVTGGSLTVNADALKLPLTGDVLKQIKANNTQTSTTRTYDLSDYSRTHGHPLRVAAQKVGGRWYPSLAYTIADNATTSAHLTAPSQAQSIAANGASSADDAVRTMVTSLLSGDIRGAIAVADPEEGAALHDYGPLIEQQATYDNSDLRLSDLAFSDSDVTGGTRVSLRSVKVTESSGDTVSLVVNGSCFDVTSSGRKQHICLDDENIVDSFIEGFTSGHKTGDDLTSAQRTAVKDLLTGSGSIGVVAVQRDGKWYVSPLRTGGELSVTLLSGLKGDDGKTLIGLIGGK